MRRSRRVPAVLGDPRSGSIVSTPNAPASMPLRLGTGSRGEEGTCSGGADIAADPRELLLEPEGGLEGPRATHLASSPASAPRLGRGGPADRHHVRRSWLGR